MTAQEWQKEWQEGMEKGGAEGEWGGLWRCELCGKQGKATWYEMVKGTTHFASDDVPKCTGRLVHVERRKLEKNGVCVCRQVVLIGELAEMERKLTEAQKALQEVHRLAHERPTKDILPIIHQLTEPWHKH